MILVCTGNAEMASTLDDFSYFIVHQQKVRQYKFVCSQNTCMRANSDGPQLFTEGQSFDSPYNKYSMYLNNLRDSISLLHVAYLVLQRFVDAERLGGLMFDKLREQEIVFDFGHISNWIPINKCMCKVQILFLVRYSCPKLNAIKQKFQDMKTATHDEKWLDDQETARVCTNLGSIQIAIFNSEINRRWDSLGG